MSPDATSVARGGYVGPRAARTRYAWRVSRKDPNSKVPWVETLEEASTDSLLYVDERGQVGSPRRQRTRTALYWAGVAAVMSAYTGLFWKLGGPIGLAVGGLLTAMLARHIPAWERSSGRWRWWRRADSMKRRGCFAG